MATGLEDPEKVTVALLVAVGAVETGRRTLAWLSKEAVRLAVPGVAVGTACAGCPPVAELLERFERGGGTFMVCPLCWNAKGLAGGPTLPNATPGGTVRMWEWIGDEGATTFSF